MSASNAYMEDEGTEMKCEDVRKQLTDMQGAGEKISPECRDHLNKCPQCRAFFHALRIVEGGEEVNPVYSPGLEEKVMARIVDDAKPSNRAFPRSLQLAAAAVLLVVMSVTLTLAVTSRSGSETVIVHLYLSAPDAVQVAVVGDWNEWNSDADLLRDKDGDGVWEIRLEVPSGQEYQYQFLIDGRQWIPDPNAAIKVDDGFGGMNSVLDI